jgi:ketosteroid isomerase-like protein
MKATIRTALLLGLLVAGNLRAADAPPALQQIRALWNDMQHAANAHDTNRFMVPFVRSPDLVFAVNGEIIRGWDALHAQQLKWWNHGKSDARYMQAGKLEIIALGPDAEVSTASFTSRRTRPDGKISTGRFVVTYVWKHLPQGWRIIYGHESWVRPSG